MPKIPHFGNTQAHKTTNACPQKVINTCLESSCHVSDHPILICLIRGYLVGMIGPISAKYPVFKVSLHSTTTLFWIVSSMFFWGPRHEPWNAVSDVKIQLTVVTIVRDSRLDFMAKNHTLYVLSRRGTLGWCKLKNPKYLLKCAWASLDQMKTLMYIS